MSLLLFIDALRVRQQEPEVRADWGLEGGENGCSIWRPVHLEMLVSRQVWNFLQGMVHRGSNQKTENCFPVRPKPHLFPPVNISCGFSAPLHVGDVECGGICALLMGFFAVFFSSRPVVDLTVSMTFTPDALPMVFIGKMDVKLCFEVDSSGVASEPGNGCLVL